MKFNNRQATLKSQRNREMRARIYWLFRVSVLVLLAVTVFWGWKLIRDPKFLPITQVKIEGTFQHVNQKTIADIATPYVTGGFFTINLSKVKEELLTFPWVDSVLIKRVWPNAVLIRVTEQQPVAKWNITSLLNAAGEEFEPPLSTFPPGLPSLQGPDDQKVFMLQQFTLWNKQLSPLQLNIVELTLTPRHSWEITLNTGTQIWLGRDNVIERLDRFVAMYPKLFSDPTKQADSVDLRYGEGLAIKWRNNINK